MLAHWENFVDRFPILIANHGMRLLAAILIYFIGKMIVGMIVNLVKKLMTRSKVDTTLVVFIGNIIHALLLLFVIIAAISRLGVQTTSLVALIGAAGLAVGLALQGSLGNFAAGVMILLFKPFKVGESVTAAGNTGLIKDIDIFHSTILTSDNRKIIVPNGAIIGGAITNFSAMPTRRIELTIAVPGTADITKVRDLLFAIMKSDERILADPAPSIVINDANAGAITFGVYPHVKNSDMGAVQSALLETIKRTFTDQGIWA